MNPLISISPKFNSKMIKLN